MKYIYFMLFFICIYESNGQEFSETYSQKRTVDSYGEVIVDWYDEQNTFRFNVNGTNDIIWIGPTGKETRFTFRTMTTGYDEDGYYYEKIEVSTWNPEFEEEEIMEIKRFKGNGLLLLIFWDGTEGFLQ